MYTYVCPSRMYLHICTYVQVCIQIYGRNPEPTCSQYQNHNILSHIMCYMIGSGEIPSPYDGLGRDPETICSLYQNHNIICHIMGLGPQRSTNGLWNYTHVTWLKHKCDMTHTHMWHDSHTHVTWLTHTCDMTHTMRESSDSNFGYRWARDLSGSLLSP